MSLVHNDDHVPSGDFKKLFLRVFFERSMILEIFRHYHKYQKDLQ